MTSIRILVDADACPVKEEIYRVAERRRIPVSVVSNSYFRVPVGPLVERVVVTTASMQRTIGLPNAPPPAQS